MTTRSCSESVRKVGARKEIPRRNATLRKKEEETMKWYEYEK
jgi:hypothetical protein